MHVHTALAHLYTSPLNRIVTSLLAPTLTKPGVGITLVGLGLHSTHRSEIQSRQQQQMRDVEAPPTPPTQTVRVQTTQLGSAGVPELDADIGYDSPPATADDSTQRGMGERTRLLPNS